MPEPRPRRDWVVPLAAAAAAVSAWLVLLTFLLWKHMLSVPPSCLCQGVPKRHFTSPMEILD